jgi:DnaJ-domain-containing protein 1
MTPAAFPLAWPPGKPRTPWQKRRKGSFSGTRAEIMQRLERQVELLGARWTVVSSDLPLRADGKPHQGRAEPDDPGVCVYFQMRDKPYAMACDTFDCLWQNAAAVANHIDATRRIERYGVATAAEALQAFVALPSPKQPHEILGVRADATPDEVRKAWRAKIADAHPDRVGTHAAAAEVNAARDAMLRG